LRASLHFGVLSLDTFSNKIFLLNQKICFLSFLLWYVCIICASFFPLCTSCHTTGQIRWNFEIGNPLAKKHFWEKSKTNMWNMNLTYIIIFIENKTTFLLNCNFFCNSILEISFYYQTLETCKYSWDLKCKKMRILYF